MVRTGALLPFVHDNFINEIDTSGTPGTAIRGVPTFKIIFV